MEFQKGNVFFSIQRSYVVNGLSGVRLTSLWPIEPLKCAIFELQDQHKCKVNRIEQIEQKTETTTKSKSQNFGAD